MLHALPALAADEPSCDRSAMKRAFWVLVLTACSKSSAPSAPPASPPAPASQAAPAHHHHHEDRHDPMVAPPPPLALTVHVGSDTQVWKQDVFDRVPHFASTNHDGDARETWSLRQLAQVVAPNARVVSVVGDKTVAITPAQWSDATHTPIVHVTRRGALKFRWADAKGAWGETVVKDVTALEIAR